MIPFIFYHGERAPTASDILLAASVYYLTEQGCTPQSIAEMLGESLSLVAHLIYRTGCEVAGIEPVWEMIRESTLYFIEDNGDEGIIVTRGDDTIGAIEGGTP